MNPKKYTDKQEFVQKAQEMGLTILPTTWGAYGLKEDRALIFFVDRAKYKVSAQGYEYR